MFRQARAGEWQGVVAAVADALHRELAAGTARVAKQQ
jgi:hypothetical protein